MPAIRAMPSHRRVTVSPMTIKPDDVKALTVAELLERDLRIPTYQRPYSWSEATALQLLDDVLHAAHASKGNLPGSSSAPTANIQHSDARCTAPVQPYVLGTVILHRDGQSFDIVDGQQRTLTLNMLVALLEGRPVIIELNDEPKNAIGRAWVGLHRRVSDIAATEEIAHFLKHHCEIVEVVTDDLDEAFRIFDSQNHRGKSLLPHDLLKAHHLRQMRHESNATRAAVIEKWEETNPAELDILFSTYLYRIHQWSRGLNGSTFEASDIDAFKGISIHRASAPWELYHLSAQTAMPMLELGCGQIDHRELDHARFQLDAPIRAGRPFFEMAMFMHRELRDLHRVAFPVEPSSSKSQGSPETGPEPWAKATGRGPFAGFSESPFVPDHRGSMPRFRYVAELYLAALLYAVNKFGREAAADVDRTLFAWAYGPRVTMQRVLAITIDNRARSEGSPFRVLRHAHSILAAHTVERPALDPPDDSAASYRKALHAHLEGKTA